MSWNAEYAILILISTIVDYTAALYMDKITDQAKRKALLILSIFINIGLLFSFKYFNFFSESVSEFLSYFSLQFSPLTLSVLLPVGISFYTFQTLSYTIDVYNKKIKPERHFGIFAVYVSFFPQLVAGPIERAKNLLPQFAKKVDFNYDRITSGLKLMAWGFFKKLIIADRVAVIVNSVFNNPSEFTAIPLILATILFAYQIYCDFSGYSDIAIGAARVLGYDLMTNFRRPYFSQSVSEFWRRWHISLSSWFKDYLYIPLGGNRVSVPRWYFNLFIVFLVSGFWHGANWTFLAWGAIHGIYLIISILTVRFRVYVVKFMRLEKIPLAYKLMRITYIFTLVCFGWIFFRANNISDALMIIKNILVNWSLSFDLSLLGLDRYDFGIAILAIIFMEIVHIVQEKTSISEFISKRHIIIRWSSYLLLVLSILLFGVFENIQFIYFQF